MGRRRAVVLFGVAALALAGCRSGSDEPPLYVQLTDNRLLRVTAAGDVLTHTRLGPAPANPSYGGLLSGSPDRQTVYALARGKRQHVSAIDGDGAVLERYELPGDVTWRRLAVGPETGRLFLAGDVAYAFGNCVQGSGLARVPLARASARLLVRDVCGDTATLLDELTLVVGRRWNRDPYGRGGDAALVFIDLEARQVERSMRLPEDPVDLLALG